MKAAVMNIDITPKGQCNRILSLSGGGVKGIAELVVLAEIEERTSKSITELFPIITGTSVGGLIAGLLTIPKEPGSSIPKYSAKEAMQIFKDAAPEIFEQHWYSGIKQVFKHKYSHTKLKKVLDTHLGNMCLGSATSRLIIPVTDLTTDNREVELFDSHNLFGDSGHSNPKLKDVLLATTAAPTYFKAVSNAKYVQKHENIKEALYAYADGGLGANRPAYEVLKKIKAEQKVPIGTLNSSQLGNIVVSLNFNNEIGASKAIPRGKNDGILGWLTQGKLVDRLLKSSEDSAVASIKNILGESDVHHEMVLQITKETSSLDNASMQNIAALEEVGRKYITEHDQELSLLCTQITNDLNQKKIIPELKLTQVAVMLKQHQNDEGYESGSDIEDIDQNKRKGETSTVISASKIARNLPIQQYSNSEAIKPQEIFQNMEFVAKKSGGANESGKYGGVYRNKLDNNLSMIKQEPDISKNISEYLGSRLFNAVSPGYGANVVLTAPMTVESELISRGASSKFDNAIYVESKFFKDYAGDMYVDMDKYMSDKTRPSAWFRKDGARPLFMGSRNKLHNTLNNAFKELGYKGFEDIMPGSLLIGDFDVHVGNIGIIRNTQHDNVNQDNSKQHQAPQMVRIDFAGSLEKLSQKIYPHSRMRHLPGFGPTNHFREFPSEMRRSNGNFGNALIVASKQDLFKEIEESFRELQKYYSKNAISTWAGKAGLKLRKDKNLDISEIEENFKILMSKRQESLQEYGMAVLLSSVINKGAGQQYNIDKKKLEELVRDYQSEFKNTLKHYESRGNLKVSNKKFRIKTVKTQIMQEVRTMLSEIDLQKAQNQDLEQDINPSEISQDSMLFVESNRVNLLQQNLENVENIDPITEAIRKEILEKQREQLRLYFSTQYLELAEHTEDDKKFKLFLSNVNAEQKVLVDKALNNEKVKAELENIELGGYRKVHTNFSADKYPGGFRPMTWNELVSENDTRGQVLTNGANPPEEICTLRERTHRTNPFTVTKQDGSQVEVKSYRIVDYPVTLDKANGRMHLSIVALDENGKKPPLSKAVYFTAHYEEGSNGKPLLKEVSSPQPIKFMGEDKDAIAYVEHSGQIYTLSVTRGKYESMMQEVAKNKGESVNLSQTIEHSSQDLLGVASNNINQTATQLSEPLIQSSVVQEEKVPTAKGFEVDSRETPNTQHSTSEEKSIAASSTLPDQEIQSVEKGKEKNTRSVTKILKSGGKVVAHELKEVVQQCGIENYAKQKAMNIAKSLAYKLASNIRQRLCGGVSESRTTKNQIIPSPGRGGMSSKSTIQK